MLVLDPNYHNSICFNIMRANGVLPPDFIPSHCNSSYRSEWKWMSEIVSSYLWAFMRIGGEKWNFSINVLRCKSLRDYNKWMQFSGFHVSSRLRTISSLTRKLSLSNSRILINGGSGGDRESPQHIGEYEASVWWMMAHFVRNIYVVVGKKMRRLSDLWVIKQLYGICVCEWVRVRMILFS